VRTACYRISCAIIVNTSRVGSFGIGIVVVVVVVVMTDLSDNWHDGIEGLVHVHVHAYLDRGSVHVCHDVSAGRIGFQHEPVQREAPRTLRMAIVYGGYLRLVFRG
jgi:hypothetical protein